MNNSIDPNHPSLYRRPAPRRNQQFLVSITFGELDKITSPSEVMEILLKALEPIPSTLNISIRCEELAP